MAGNYGRVKLLKSILASGLVTFAAAFAGSALATLVEPCESGAINASIYSSIPLNGGGQTYCQSAWGWSDSWFPTSQPSTYNQHLDVLSGDNAPSLFYFIGDLKVGAGSGIAKNPYDFMSPFADLGTLNSLNIGSNVTVVTDIGPGGTSKVALGQLDVQITTTVGVSGITETFLFTNTSADVAITDLGFDDYFNFHANGSLSSGDTTCPTTTYNPTTGTVTTTGSSAPGCSPIVKNGTMFGSSLPVSWDLGLATSVLSDIAAGTYNGSLGSVKGDGAADLLWDLGPLAPGGQTTFTIYKNFERVPEPATLLLFGGGLAGLGLIRRQRKLGRTAEPATA